MSDSTILPAPRATLVAHDGTTSPEFYRFFRGLSVTAGLPARVDDLTVRVDALEEGNGSTGNVVGKQSIVSAGVLSGGLVIVRLDGDQDVAPALSFYGAIAEGVKGWQTYSANFVALDNGDGTSSLDLAHVTDAGGGTLQRTAFDAYGRKTGTSAATTTDLAEGSNLYFTSARVLATVLAGLSTATNAVIAATDTVLGALGKLQAQITDNLLPQGYIDGLKMVWVSGTALTVTTGAAYIPSLGKVLRVTSDIAKTGLSLTASTWYHVHLYSNAGTPDVEISTTAPAAAYSGFARTKTGDTSRRYVGSVLSDGAGNLIPFSVNGSTFTYLSQTMFSLSNGVATIPTNVSLAAFVPITGTHAKITIGNNDAVAQVRLAATNAGTNVTVGVNGTNNLAIDMPLTTAQTMSYAYAATPSAGCYIRVFGYIFER